MKHYMKLKKKVDKIKEYLPKEHNTRLVILLPKKQYEKILKEFSQYDGLGFTNLIVSDCRVVSLN